MATTLGDVEITVRLNLDQARKDADNAPGGGGEGAPRLPGSSPPSERPGRGRDGGGEPEGGAGPRGRGGRRRRGEGSYGPGGDDGDGEPEFLGTALERGRGLLRAARGGGLYEEALAVAGALPIPGAGVALRGAELTRRYGPAAGEVVTALARKVPGGPGSEAIAALVAEAVTSATAGLASELNDLKAKLDAVTMTYDQSLEAFRGIAALGADVDPEALGEFAGNLYSINDTLARVSLTRQTRTTMRAARALSGVIPRLFSGGGPR